MRIVLLGLSLIAATCASAQSLPSKDGALIQENVTVADLAADLKNAAMQSLKQNAAVAPTTAEAGNGAASAPPTPTAPPGRIDCKSSYLNINDRAACIKNGGVSPKQQQPAAVQPGAAGTRSGDMTNYGGQGRFPGESVADCNKRLGGAARDHRAPKKGVREKCGYTGFDGVYN